MHTSFPVPYVVPDDADRPDKIVANVTDDVSLYLALHRVEYSSFAANPRQFDIIAMRKETNFWKPVKNVCNRLKSILGIKSCCDCANGVFASAYFINQSFKVGTKSLLGRPSNRVDSLNNREFNDLFYLVKALSISVFADTENHRWIKVKSRYRDTMFHTWVNVMWSKDPSVAVFYTYGLGGSFIEWARRFNPCLVEPLRMYCDKIVVIIPCYVKMTPRLLEILKHS